MEVYWMESLPGATAENLLKVTELSNLGIRNGKSGTRQSEKFLLFILVVLSVIIYHDLFIL